MEWIIFVDLGFIVFLIVMAAILAAVGTAGAVMWIWPAIKIIVGVLFAIVMVVGIYLYVKRVITSERSIFTKIYIFLLCAVNAIWSGVLVWEFIESISEIFANGDLFSSVIAVIFGIPILGCLFGIDILATWLSAGAAIESLDYTEWNGVKRTLTATLTTAASIAVPLLLIFLAPKHYFS